MVELAFELVGVFNLGLAVAYWLHDTDDIMHWLFYLLFSIISYINAIRYKDDK